MSHALTWRQEAATLSRAAARLDALLAKGYPEYQPDQDRGEDGKWTGGGGGGKKPRAARGAGKPRGGALSGKPSGKKPRKPLSDDPKAVRARERARERYAQRVQQQAAKRAADMKDVLDRLNKARTEAEQADVATRALRVRRDLMRAPDAVWRSPTLADEVFKALTTFEVALGALLLGPLTGGVSTAMWAAGIGVVGTYLMLRFAWRKISTLGRYQGVEWPNNYDPLRNPFD